MTAVKIVPERATSRPRFHYLECPKCESCFKVAKDITSVPAHKCWAEMPRL